MNNAEAGPSSGSDDLLNEAAIAELRELLGDELPEFVRKFRDACVHHLDTAKAALALGDGVVLQRAVHTLKGSAGVLGATPLVDACMEFELRLKAGNRGDAAAYLDSLERLSQAISEILARHLAG